MPQPADTEFFKVPLGARVSNPCSPKPAWPGFDGLLVQAPGRAPLGGRIPLCGYAKLPFGMIPGDPIDAIVVWAVNKGTHQAYSGRLPEPRVERDPPPDPGVPFEDLRGALVGGWFNLDLAPILGLPAEPGTYDVYLDLAGEKSNVVTIELYDEEAPPA